MNSTNSDSACLRLVPLGGLGEIGMNCLALEVDGSILVIDCGAAFPDDDLGIDVWHPDFSWLRQRADRIAGVFLTHGHEDHVGALPYLLRELEVPVFGPPHALGVARRRLAEHDFSAGELDLREAFPGVTYELGGFEVEPVRVAHSIIEASALRVRTSAGTLVHSGDFNLDPDPPDGEPTNEARLAAIGDEGVAVLLSDSTNIDVPVRAGSERSVGHALEELIGRAPERVVIALFASNIQRLILLGDIAKRTGRKICLMGRSLETQVAVASDISRLRWPSNLLISQDQARELPRNQLLALAGGTQAEKNSAMRRIAEGIHPHLTLEPDDTVIFSSRVIPGNDRPVIGMINTLLRAGIRVHSRITDPAVHTSGHAGRSEQQRMIELIRPRCFLPVHGTLHHMLRHAELAQSLGIAQTLVVENGTPVVCDGETLKAEPPVAHGRVPIAIGGETLNADVLRLRAELGRTGFAVISVVLDKKKRLAAAPEVSTKGIPNVDGSSDAKRVVAREVARAAESYKDGSGLDFLDTLRRTARRRLEDLSGTRPVVEVQIVNLD